MVKESHNKEKFKHLNSFSQKLSSHKNRIEKESDENEAQVDIEASLCSSQFSSKFNRTLIDTKQQPDESPEDVVQKDLPPPVDLTKSKDPGLSASLTEILSRLRQQTQQFEEKKPEADITRSLDANSSFEAMQQILLKYKTNLEEEEK